LSSPNAAILAKRALLGFRQDVPCDYFDPRLNNEWQDLETGNLNVMLRRRRSRIHASIVVAQKGAAQRLPKLRSGSK